MCRSCPVIDWELELTSFGVPEHRPVDAERGAFVIWFDQLEPAHAPLVGGKSASLGALTAAGLPVPPGFALTVEAYQQIWRTPGLADGVNQLLASIDHDAHGANQKISRDIRNRIEAAPVPVDVAAELRNAYVTLCRHCGVDDVAVAVRSSATAEDLPDASFAGQQDSYLWVRGADAVIEHVRRCWSSLFTDRDIAYRHAKGALHRSISMSVAVQKMVNSETSGVAFTINPTTGDRSQIAIDSSWGLGEAIVSGEVTPDHFVVDKVLRDIIRREIHPKLIEFRRDNSGTVGHHPVPIEKRLAPSLSDRQVIAVALLARQAEQHYGCPQDVEWAVDADLPDGENIVLLQSRPETVWSRRARPTLTTATSTGMTSMVSTLMSPLYARSSSSGSTN
jgi:pyruvate, water dikinase